MDLVFSSDPYHPLSLVQIIGYVGMALGVITFLQKSDVRMKIYMVVMTTILCVHFTLLGRYMAAISAVLAGSRAGLSIFDFVRKNAHSFAAVYFVITCIVAYITYESWIDILAFMATLNGTFAFFYLQGLWLRFALLFGGALWLIHNILALSYGPLVMEAFILLANITTIYRLRGDQKKAALLK